LLQDGKLGIGVFPKGKEILIGGERQDAGVIGIRSCEVFDCKALVRAVPKCANAPVQQFQTMPLWSVLTKTPSGKCETLRGPATVTRDWAMKAGNSGSWLTSPPPGNPAPSI
jgi:hypothetical protein